MRNGDSGSPPGGPDGGGAIDCVAPQWGQETLSGEISLPHPAHWAGVMAPPSSASVEAQVFSTCQLSVTPERWANLNFHGGAEPFCPWGEINVVAGPASGNENTERTESNIVAFEADFSSNAPRAASGEGQGGTRSENLSTVEWRLGHWKRLNSLIH